MVTNPKKGASSLLSSTVCNMDRSVHLTNIFDPASTPAQAILELSWLVLWICAGIFVIVVGLLTYILIRFRRRREIGRAHV